MKRYKFIFIGVFIGAVAFVVSIVFEVEEWILLVIAFAIWVASIVFDWRINKAKSKAEVRKEQQETAHIEVPKYFGRTELNNNKEQTDEVKNDIK